MARIQAQIRPVNRSTATDLVAIFIKCFAPD